MADTVKCPSCGKTVEKSEIIECKKCGGVCCFHCYPKHLGHCERGARELER